MTGNIAPEVLGAIEGIIARYKAKKNVRAMPNTPAEIAEINAVIAKSDPSIERTVKSDVFFVDHEGFSNYLEIKTVQPNYDTCDKMKTRILTIHAMLHANQANVRALAVFPHNPNGFAGTYSWPPLRYFLDPEHDWKARGLALMGRGLWNFIGNSEDTYDDMLDCFYEVSQSRKNELLDLLQI